MARTKQRAPLQKTPSSDVMERLSDLPESKSQLQNGHSTPSKTSANGSANPKPEASESEPEENSPGLLQLAICVGGIYASFLLWGLLQEAITTTSYPVHGAKGEAESTERFTFSIVLNTIQSCFAAVTGSLYLYFSTPKGQGVPSIFPNQRILFPLILVSISSSLASPFGYAGLQHIDYLTFILAKSCKLLPVMLLHLTVFRKRYPLYKYAVVMMVTLGVATFTLYHPGTSKKVAASTHSGQTLYGLFLLFINLLLDGLTNATQDHLFTSPSLYTRYTGPQMMVAQNVLASVLTTAYLLVTPYLTDNGPIVSLLPFQIPRSAGLELSSAISFLQRHPQALKNVLGFAACGAVGQVFIYYTLSKFSSLLLVTVTVTRKMLSMIISVFWFGHSLTHGQWLGVLLVFGGVGAEGIVQRREKKAKEAAKLKKKL